MRENGQKYTILAINPGSTSTKIAVYENETLTFKKSIRHSTEVINSFETIYDQFEFRREAVLNTLKVPRFLEISLNLS